MQPLQTAYCTLKAGPKFSLRLSPTLIFSQVLAAITKTALWAAKIATDGAFHGMAVQVTDMRGLTRLGFVDHAILTDVFSKFALYFHNFLTRWHHKSRRESNGREYSNRCGSGQMI